MRMPLPVREIVDHTVHTIQARRTRRERKAQQLGMMIASRVVRPAHVEIRHLRPAKHIPNVFVTTERPKVTAEKPEPESTHQRLELNWNTPVVDILDYLRQRLLAA